MKSAEEWVAEMADGWGGVAISCADLTVVLSRVQADARESLLRELGLLNEPIPGHVPEYLWSDEHRAKVEQYKAQSFSALENAVEIAKSLLPEDTP